MTGSGGKLVRNKIPAIIRAQGMEPVTRIAGFAEYADLLRDKLAEETREFYDTGDRSELADMAEVLYAIAALAGVSRAELEWLRAAKEAERGGFSGRVVWSGTGRAAPLPLLLNQLSRYPDSFRSPE